MKILVGCLILAVILAGCDAQPTPLAAVDVPTLAPDTAVTQPPPAPLRYGITSYTLPFSAEIYTLAPTALVEQLPDNPDLNAYDIAISYGTYNGWQQSPVSHHIALIVNPALAPLDNPEVRTIISHILDSSALAQALAIPGTIPADSSGRPITQLRTELANAGYPDGFSLTLAMPTLPGAELISQQLAAANLELTVITLPADGISEYLSDSRAHLLLVLYVNDEQRQLWGDQAGESNVLELYSLPISYVAGDGLKITFTENGWPIATR